MNDSTVRLKQLAEEATPGPWTVGKDDASHLIFYPYDTGETDLSRIVISDTEVSMGDKRFIAAANPEAVLGLIARIEKLEAALRFYADHNNWMVTRKDDLHEAKRTIVGDVDSYGYQRDEYSPNILQIIGGKTAREALKEETL